LACRERTRRHATGEGIGGQQAVARTPTEDGLGLPEVEWSDSKPLDAIVERLSLRQQLLVDRDQVGQLVDRRSD